MNKIRIDIYLSDNKYCKSRTQAQRMIMAGLVLVNEIPVKNLSQMISETDKIRIKEKLKFVGRGALKLEKALDSFNIDVKGKRFIDFGASTGGFTDVLLQRGAAHVTCVDVGYGQLAWKIRNNSRVKVLERTNARYLTLDMIDERADGAVCDVSFISVKKIIPVMQLCTKDDGFIVILIKPQFEAGKKFAGKKGIIRDKKIHLKVINEIIKYLVDETQFIPQAIDYSPIKGQKGNIEFLLYALKNSKSKLSEEKVEELVDAANNQL